MQYRNFQGEKIAEVGLGTWQLGNDVWGAVDEATAQALLETYVEKGGNFLDTADVYGAGESERRIGQFLKKVEQPVYVATKLGRRGDGGLGWPQNFTLDNMRRQVEDSRKNLGQDQLFLEQLHCIDPEALRRGEVFDNLRTLQSEGLIRHWGASVETEEEALLCLEQEGIASLQVIFNLFRQHYADRLFEKAQERGVALIVRVPLASGLLTGKFSAETHFGPNDHRSFNANGEQFNVGETFSGIPFSQGVELAGKIQHHLGGAQMAQQSLRWILDHAAVTAVIPGATKVSQVERNVAVSDMHALPGSVHRELRALYDREIRKAIRGKV